MLDSCHSPWKDHKIIHEHKQESNPVADNNSDSRVELKAYMKNPPWAIQDSDESVCEAAQPAAGNHQL